MRFFLRGASALALLFAIPACGDDDAGSMIVDASVDQSLGTWPDAAEQAACAGLVLAPAPLQGTTPWGTLDLALDYFGAGDCLTITHAAIAWRGAGGEILHVEFPYPVQVRSDGRRYVAAGTVDEEARFMLERPNAAAVETVAAIRLDVAAWQEGQPTHDIDAAFSVVDARFAIAPLRITGTFCDWLYYLC